MSPSPPDGATGGGAASAGRAPANPFPGPRPFAENEHELFFGRERELSDMVALLFAQRAVLLHGPSGGGKSSLVYAGLLPRARARGFEFLPVARVRGVSGHIGAGSADDSPRNRYLDNIMDTWRAAGLDVPDGAATLTEAVSALPPADEPGRVVVFDQFEELFVFHPERWKDRADLVSQIQAALDHDPLLHVLIVLRDDYLARLQPLTTLLRDRLSTRYPLRGLDAGQALDAVVRPFRATGRVFQPGVAEALVKALRAQPGVAPEDPAYEAEEVEGVQLQIVCRTFFERLPGDVAEIGASDVERHANVDQALVTFYEQALAAAVKGHPRAHEKRVRTWFERKLITPGRTRSIVFRDAKDTAGLPNDVVDELERRRIVRSEPRGPAQWYELPHDRLIDAVLASNRIWYAARTRTLTRLAAALGVLVVLAAAVSFVLVFRGEDAEEPDLAAPKEANVSVPGQPVEFLVTGAAGQLLTAIMTPEDGLVGELRLVDPGGVELRRSVPGPSRPVLTFELPADGEYRVEAGGLEGSTGPFTISFDTQYVDGRAEISAGGAVPGEITQWDEVDLYTFHGRAGTVARVTVTGESFDGDLVLVAPGGEAFVSVSPYAYNSSLLAAVLPEDGTYELRASSRRRGTGAYRLDLEFPDQAARPGISTGAIDDQNRVGVRTIRSGVGGALDVYYAPEGNGAVSLLAADGRRLAHHAVSPGKKPGGGFSWVMNPASSYLLVVEAEVIPTPYVLTLEIEDAVQLTSARADGDLQRAGQLAVYHYLVEQRGGSLGVLVDPVTGLDPVVQILEPDGTVLIETDAQSPGEDEVFTVPLITTGPHLVVVKAADPTQTGGFRLTVRRIPDDATAPPTTGP